MYKQYFVKSYINVVNKIDLRKWYDTKKSRKSIDNAASNLCLFYF